MKRFLLFACACLTINSGYAQLHRFGSWNSVNVEYSFTKHLGLQAGQTLRYYPSLAYEEQWLTDIGVNYELSKHFDIGGGYRFMFSETNRSGRPMMDLAYTNKLKKFQIGDRVRYQYDVDEKSRIKQYIRNKVTLKYRKPKKFTPQIGAELFYLLGADNYFIDGYRFYAGTEYKINKHFDIDIEWIRNQDIQVVKPLTTDVLQLQLNYGFSPTRRKNIGDMSSLNR